MRCVRSSLGGVDVIRESDSSTESNQRSSDLDKSVHTPRVQQSCTDDVQRRYGSDVQLSTSIQSGKRT